MIRKSSNQKIADKLKTGNLERDLRIKNLLLQLLKDVGTNVCDYEVDELTFNLSDIEKISQKCYFVKYRENIPMVKFHKNIKAHSLYSSRK